MRLTTSPPSRAECHEIWDPKPPGTLWVTLGLLRDSFTYLPHSMQYTIYNVLNPTTAQLTTQDHLSLYSVPPTCFGLSMAINMEVSKGMQQRQILLQVCICTHTHL
jgi:hypothetical protein